MRTLIESCKLPGWHRRVRHVLALLFLLGATGIGHAELPRDNFHYPVLIETSSGSSGSGFFLEANGQIYLVTARHVLYSTETGDVYDESIRIVSQALPPEVGSFAMKVDLAALSSMGRLRIHRDKDVAVVQIAYIEEQAEKAPINYYAGVRQETTGGFMVVAGRNTCFFGDVRETSEVYVLGYPKSVGVHSLPQVDFRVPLARKGIVAGKNAEIESVILDCQVDGGNSGGPVIQVCRDKGGNERYCVIGLVSEFVPLAEEWVSKTRGQVNVQISNSGYSVVVPMDPVWELIDTPHIRLTYGKNE